MRKTAAIIITITLLTLISLAGCGTDREKLQSEFNDLITGPVTSEQIPLIGAFLDENIQHVGQDLASHMVFEFHEFLLDYTFQNEDGTAIQELSVYFDAETGRIDEEKIQHSVFKSFYDDITVGLFMMMYENEPVLRVDHARLLEKYGEYISESMQALYHLAAEVVERPTTENATLAISWKELVDRTYEAEKIIKTYPDDQRIIEEVMWIFRTHLNTMLMGTTNTPIFDYRTKEFSDSARAAYQEFMLSESDAVLTWTLKEYFTYLDSIDFTLDFNDITMSKVFFNTCDWLVSEAEKWVRK